MRKGTWMVHLLWGCGVLLLSACKAMPHRVESPAAPSTSTEAATPASHNPSEDCYEQIPGGTVLRQTPECSSAAPASSAPQGTPAQPASTPEQSSAPPADSMASDSMASDDAVKVADLPLPNLPPLARTGQVAPPAPAARTAAADAGRHATLAQARSALQNAQNRLDLSEPQLARLHEAQSRIDAGDTAGAMALLQPLDEELASEVRTYTVRHGGSLRDVAARPEVYGNPDLWPLLWQANRERVAQPSHLDRGVRLIVPAHPTAAEVAQALDYAHRNDLAQAQTSASPTARAN